MSKTKAKANSIEEDDLFDSEQEINLTEIDTNMIVKLLVHCLSQCLVDAQNKPPQFVRSNDTLFFELAERRFTIEIRDNNLYS